MGFLIYLSATPTPIPLETNAGTLVNLLGTVGSLFSTFPVNLFLAGGVIAIVFKIFRQAKGAAR
jgi:hypothetical protein